MGEDFRNLNINGYVYQKKTDKSPSIKINVKKIYKKTSFDDERK